MDQESLKKSTNDAKKGHLSVEEYQKQLRRLASELSLAEARERREIASDLHDHIGQALAYVSQKLSILKGNSIFSGMESDFVEIDKILNQTIKYTRDLTVEISPPILYEFGLTAAIEWLIERAEIRYHLKISFVKKRISKDISEDIKVFIFKSVKELIHNVSKHANASKIEISVIFNQNDFIIRISDNGNGFDISTLEQRMTDDCCFGLFSIKERLSYIGGQMIIESTPENGTQVEIHSPYLIHKGISND